MNEHDLCLCTRLGPGRLGRGGRNGCTRGGQVGPQEIVRGKRENADLSDFYGPVDK